VGEEGLVERIAEVVGAVHEEDGGGAHGRCPPVVSEAVRGNEPALTESKREAIIPPYPYRS
jgi:hypothetical protein